jgi:predicted MFS family arabinose efflux permease
VDAATFAVSAALLSRIHVKDAAAPATKSYLADLRDGWDAFRSRRWLWAFVAWFSFTNLLYGCWLVVGPLVAERDLGGAGPWGLILASAGIGGVVGGLLALRVAPRRPLLFAALGLSILLVPLALLAAGLPAPLIAAGAIAAEIGLVVSIAFLPLGLAIWGRSPTPSATTPRCGSPSGCT